jgi:hypothetical protein
LHALVKILIEIGHLGLAESAIDQMWGIVQTPKGGKPGLRNHFHSLCRGLIFAHIQDAQFDRAAYRVPFLSPLERFHTWGNLILASLDKVMSTGVREHLGWIDQVRSFSAQHMPEHEALLEQLIVKERFYEIAKTFESSTFGSLGLEQVIGGDSYRLAAMMIQQGVAYTWPAGELIYLLPLAGYRPLPKYISRFLAVMEYAVSAPSDQSVQLRERSPREMLSLSSRVPTTFTGRAIRLSLEEAKKLGIPAVEEPQIGDEPPGDKPALLIYRSQADMVDPRAGGESGEGISGLFGGSVGGNT